MVVSLDVDVPYNAYMDAVFRGGDIVKQLPQEAKRFYNINKQFLKMVGVAVETRIVVDTCHGVDLKVLKPSLPVPGDAGQKRSAILCLPIDSDTRCI
jgi:hypothetical protein